MFFNFNMSNFCSDFALIDVFFCPDHEFMIYSVFSVILAGSCKIILNFEEFSH